MGKLSGGGKRMVGARNQLDDYQFRCLKSEFRKYNIRKSEIIISKPEIDIEKC
jgi:hypothetical protein